MNREEYEEKKYELMKNTIRKNVKQITENNKQLLTLEMLKQQLMHELSKIIKQSQNLQQDNKIIQNRIDTLSELIAEHEGEEYELQHGFEDELFSVFEEEDIVPLANLFFVTTRNLEDDE